MAETDATYQANVGIEQGANSFFCKQAGEMKFYDGSFTGEETKYLLNTHLNKTVIINSAGVVSAAGGSAPPILPSGGGRFTFYIASVCSNGSMRLPSAKLGQRLILDFARSASVASVIFYPSDNGLAGVSLIGQRGSVLSGLEITQGANGDLFPIVTLVCATDGVWSIEEVVGDTAGVVEIPAT